MAPVEPFGIFSLAVKEVFQEWVSAESCDLESGEKSDTEHFYVERSKLGLSTTVGKILSKWKEEESFDIDALSLDIKVVSVRYNGFFFGEGEGTCSQSN